MWRPGHLVARRRHRIDGCHLEGCGAGILCNEWAPENSVKGV